jgi:hypothetical protein
MTPPGDLKTIQLVLRTAYDAVPFYRTLYQALPRVDSMDDFRQVPMTSRDLFAVAGDLSQCLVRDAQLVITWPPYSSQSPAFPFALPRTAADVASMTRRLMRLLRRVGGRRGQWVTVVSDYDHKYFAAHLTELLHSCGLLTELHLRRRAEEIVDGPPLLGGLAFVCGGPLLVDAIANVAETVVSFMEAGASAAGRRNVINVLSPDELPLLAIGDSIMRSELLCDDLFIERSESGWIVTELRVSSVPLIRYRMWPSRSQTGGGSLGAPVRRSRDVP